MNDQRRLAICEICENKSFSPKTGINCGLTNAKPTFERSCKDFAEDPSMVTKKRRLAESHDRMPEVSGPGQEATSSPSIGRIILTVILLIVGIFILLDKLSR